MNMAPKITTPLDSLPVGRLGIIPLKSCEKLGAKVNDYIVKWRKDRDHQEKNNLQFEGYERPSYLIDAQTPASAPGKPKVFWRNLSGETTSISWWMSATIL